MQNTVTDTLKTHHRRFIIACEASWWDVWASWILHFHVIRWMLTETNLS